MKTVDHGIVWLEVSGGSSASLFDAPARPHIGSVALNYNNPLLMPDRREHRCSGISWVFAHRTGCIRPQTRTTRVGGRGRRALTAALVWLYSIISSARASTVGGTVSPSAFAVLRL